MSAGRTHGPEEVRRRAETEPDYVGLRRFRYSLEEVMRKHEVVPDETIAKALGIGVHEVEERWQRIVVELRETMGVSNDDGG